MEIFILIGLILFVVSAIVLLKIIKHVFVAVLSVIGLFLVLTAAFGFVAYKDVMDIKENAPISPELLVLKDNSGNIVAAAYFDPDKKPIEKSIKSLSSEEIAYVQSEFSKNNIDGLRKDLKNNVVGLNETIFKIIDCRYDLINDAPIEKIDLNVITLTKNEVIEIMDSDDALDTLVDKMLSTSEFEENRKKLMDSLGIDILEYGKEQIKSELQSALGGVKTNEEIKGIIFVMFMGSIMSDDGLQGIQYFYDSYKDGTLMIYPETITFSILKMSPRAIIEQVIQQVNPTEANVTN